MSTGAPPQQILRELGRRVRQAREKAQLSQEEAAGRAKIDARRWQRIEAGEVNCTVGTLARVAKALGISFWSLVGS